MMTEINRCPSTLADGYSSYSPKALKSLFFGKKVSPMLDFSISGLKKSDIVKEEHIIEALSYRNDL